MTTLSVCPFFDNHCTVRTRVVVNHCAIRTRDIVNHHPRVQPMHHSVLPEKGGVVSQGQSSSSRQALTRRDRTAKRNPRLARARTGGPHQPSSLAPRPLKRTNSDQTTYLSSYYFCSVYSRMHGVLFYRAIVFFVWSKESGCFSAHPFLGFARNSLTTITGQVFFFRKAVARSSG